MGEISLSREQVTTLVGSMRARGVSDERIGLELARDGLGVLDLADGQAPPGVDPESWELDRVVRAVSERDESSYAVALDKVITAAAEALHEAASDAEPSTANASADDYDHVELDRR